MEKLVSIILPTYNGAQRISTSIRSVQNQSYKDWELLVINDGSTDNTEKIVKKFSEEDSRIVYIKNEINSGIQKTLNNGLRSAKGEYVARIDDDDEWIDKDKLKKQVEFLEKNTDYVLVGTGVVVINESGKELFRYLLPSSNGVIEKKLLSKNCFVHSSVVFRKESAIRVGKYSEEKEIKHLEDYDLWLKLGTVGKLANLPIYSLKYTVREGSLSYKNRLEVFKKLLSNLKRHKNYYKGYYSALVRVYVRFILYSIYLKLPKKFSLNWFIKFYKENW